MKDPIKVVLHDLLKAPELVLKDAEHNARRIIDGMVLRGRLSAEDAKAIMAEMNEKVKTNRKDLEATINSFINERLGIFNLNRPRGLAGLRKKVNSLIDRAERLETLWRNKQENSGD